MGGLLSDCLDHYNAMSAFNERVMEKPWSQHDSASLLECCTIINITAGAVSQVGRQRDKWHLHLVISMMSTPRTEALSGLSTMYNLMHQTQLRPYYSWKISALRTWFQGEKSRSVYGVLHAVILQVRIRSERCLYRAFEPEQNEGLMSAGGVYELWLTSVSRSD